jgi:hypothetical protein
VGILSGTDMMIHDRTASLSLGSLNLMGFCDRLTAAGEPWHPAGAS